MAFSSKWTALFFLKKKVTENILYLFTLFFLSLAIGAAYGTSKAGIGIAGIGSFKPELVMKVKAFKLNEN